MRLSRAGVVAALGRAGTVDVVVVGGGATGAGIALDAAARGLSVALFERAGFGAGTSARSSKLIHGGLRYLALGQWGLVREALRERARLLALAPALVRPLGFVLPCYGRWERLEYTCGLTLYDALAGGTRLAPSRRLDTATARRLVPGLAATGLRGAVHYTDAGFDDARLLLCLLDQARLAGAHTLNHAEVVGFSRNAAGRLDGVAVTDHATGTDFTLGTRVVINAAGPWSDALRRLDSADAPPQISPSQGAHLVVGREFLGGTDALVFPRTPDGRIMFAIPWHCRVLLGTTDTALTHVPAEVRALPEEVDEILAVAGAFLARPPTRADVPSVDAGLRPLSGAARATPSARRSREHTVDVSDSGLVSVSGGKWTTYRVMAAAAIDRAVALAGLAAPASVTATRPLAVAPPDHPYRAYGRHADAVAALAAHRPELARTLHPDLPYRGVDVVWAARAELALHVTDVLASHTRAYYLDAAAAAEGAPAVATLMAPELAADRAWIARETAAAQQLAAQYSLTPIRVRDTPG